MVRRIGLAVVVAILGAAGVANAQATATVTMTPTPTITSTRTQTPTRTAVFTGTITPTPTKTGAPEAATHVHALEETILGTDAGMPHYADLCVADSYAPQAADTCRCVIFITRISGTNALKVRCPDGVVETIDSW